ncbi:nucleotide exchange factor GrpE [Phreatobacter sp.]|uniref:nucleotide exchange factor GrpE n=1 Tax=Phreatobacter sp. TaxID=1966341 RepID=UPI003F713742
MTDPKDTRTEAQNDDMMADETPAGAAAADEIAPVDLIEEVRAEAAMMKDRLLRTLAEMENIRKRTEREVADARTYAVSSFARDLLNVADNIRRAFESLPAEALPADGPLKAFADGVDLTERELLKTLEKHGIRRIEPDGQKFDPNLHQAMFEMPNDQVPAGMVVQTVQAGYTIGERVLRPALVGVSKGGPKVAPAQTPSESK